MKDFPADTINEFKYMSKIGDIYFFVKNTIDIGLSPINIERAAAYMTAGVKEAASEFIVPIGDKPTGNKDSILDFLEKEIYKTNLAKATNYKKLILNHGLILFCSVFDDFLFALLKAVLENNPTLCNWDTKDDILSDFSYRNIKEKTKIIRTKLRITEKEFFDFSKFTDEVQIKYSGYNFDKLIEIYKKRDSAAHTDRFIIKNIDELSHYKGLFEKLILSLSFLFRMKWRVKSGFIELYKNSKKT